VENTNFNQKTKKELQAGFEIQARHNLYVSPEFPFLHCLGVWNFISAFTYTVQDQEDKGPQPFGVLHLYWDKEGHDNVLKPDGTPHLPGVWKSKWYEPGETVQEVTYLERCGMTAEGREKVNKIFADIRNKEMLRQFEKYSQAEQEENVIIN
tara:strand:- start:28 stop:483 length:456 start_codon:yes stop_codon:yes gene_type:complete